MVEEEKNKFLIEKIKNNFEQLDIDLIDKYEIDGDFIESQAFAYLAIRSLENYQFLFQILPDVRSQLQVEF